MAGVTDDLIALAEQAVAGSPREVGRRLDRLHARHRNAVRALKLDGREARRSGRRSRPCSPSWRGSATASSCCGS